MKKIILIILFSLMCFTTNAQVNIIIPDIEESGLLLNDTFSLDITSSDLTGLGVIAFQFTLTYDPSIVLAININTFGTILDATGWSVMPNLDTPGELRVIGWGANPLSGSGDFISVLFEVFDPSGYTDLVATEFLFNAGTPSVTVVDGSILLPVELISFNASQKNSTVLLEWITATEHNNSGFEIQRSRLRPSKMDYAEVKWERLGFIDGKGTSSEINKYSFVDNSPPSGKVFYRLVQHDFNGTKSYSDVVQVSVTKINFYKLFQNYPNPFNPSTEISFEILSAGNVKLHVYNSLGELVAKLLNEYLEPGKYIKVFTPTDLPSAIYYYNLQVFSSENSLEFDQFKKMVLVK